MSFDGPQRGNSGRTEEICAHFRPAQGVDCDACAHSGPPKIAKFRWGATREREDGALRLVRIGLGAREYICT